MIKKLITPLILSAFLLTKLPAINVSPDFEGDFDKMAEFARNSNSARLITKLDNYINLCPDLVKKILEEEQRNLTLDQINQLNQRVLKLSSQFDNKTITAIWTRNRDTNNYPTVSNTPLGIIESKIKQGCAKYEVHNLYGSLPTPLNDNEFTSAYINEIIKNDNAFNQCLSIILDNVHKIKDPETLELINILEEITTFNMEYGFHETQFELNEKEIQKECAKYGVKIHNIVDQEPSQLLNDYCNSKTELIQCLIKAYSSNLVSKAEEEIIAFLEKEEL